MIVVHVCIYKSAPRDCVYFEKKNATLTAITALINMVQVRPCLAEDLPRGAGTQKSKPGMLPVLVQGNNVCETLVSPKQSAEARVSYHCYPSIRLSGACFGPAVDAAFSSLSLGRSIDSINYYHHKESGRFPFQTQSKSKHQRFSVGQGKGQARNIASVCSINYSSLDTKLE
jgi:hypothetical protein